MDRDFTITTLYAVVPHLPDAPNPSVFNMPEPPAEWATTYFADVPDGEPFTINLVVGWNAEEAAHIKAVAGWGLGTDGRGVWARHSRTGEPGFEGGTKFASGLLPVGVVAARFNVTGCHRAWNDDEPCHCTSRWARWRPDGLFHWTGTVEKVNP